LGHVQVHGGIRCGWKDSEPCDPDDDYPHNDNPWTANSLIFAENPFVDFGQVRTEWRLAVKKFD
jgi:hypothetical protein